MASYMLLLYRSDEAAAEAAQREGEADLWAELTQRLRDAGLLAASGRLYPVDTATTVRVRHDEVELTDGPFAATKEALAGFYVLECPDLDEALAQAARLPLAATPSSVQSWNGVARPCRRADPGPPVQIAPPAASS